MAVFRTVIRSDLQKPLVVQQLSGNMFTADNASNEIAVEVTNGGEPVTLSGAVTAYAVRADGVTAMFSGTISGNVASVILPATCYTQVGTLSIVVKVGSTTVGACTCYVYRTTTDEIVDPGHVIPSIDELLEQIDACRTATTNANTAASNANANATVAENAATNANTKAGVADTAAQNANAKATAADTAATNANTAAGKIDNMTVAATGLPAGSAPVATITEVDGHKHIAFQIPKGDKGKDFHIAKTFSSISAMMAYTGTDLEKYDFAMIDTGNVEDPDTGKLYCYEPDENPKWSYIGDLSGAQGIKGETGTGIDHVSLNADYTLTVYYDDGTSDTTTSIRGATGITPNITIGTVTTLLPGQQAYVTRDPSSTAENPVFNFGIPKGDTGSASNVYGTTVPMSDSDSTTVYDAIGEKLDKDQGAANAGKFMKVGADGELVPDTVPDPTGKADKVQNAVAGNFAGLDANGNLTDSGKKPSDFLTQHQDISGKADKVSGATNGNFAGLDANGNLTDSGNKATDFVAKAQGTQYTGWHLEINNSGNLVPAPYTPFVGTDGTLPGQKGLVPAPAVADQTKYLKGDGTWAAVPQQDISGKADKVDNATYGDLAKLDSQGNLVDSGIASGDVVVKADIASKTWEPETGDTLLSFINSNCNFAALPFSFAKTGSAVPADTPTEIAGSMFTGICIGHDGYITVKIQAFSTTATQYTFERDYYQGTWRTNWASIGAALQEDLNNTQDGIAIVADGDTHDAISSGQFVLVRSHPTLAKGMYKATAAIAANGALSTSNLTADGSGGLNDLQAQVTSLNSNIAQKFRTITSGSMHDIRTSGVYYLTGGVTDKPAGNGGMYIVSAFNTDLLVGLFTNTDGLLYNVRYVSGQWFSTAI